MSISNPMLARKTRWQIEEDLLILVEEATKLYDTSTGKAREAALQRYKSALDRFNQYVIHGDLLKD
jgi:hypothetical protein